MNRVKSFLWYLLVFNISFASSYFITYFRNGTFDSNFNELNLNEFSLLIILNVSTSLIYYVISFLIVFESRVFLHLFTFTTQQLLFVFILWLIKFTDLSRSFYLIQSMTFFIFTMLVIRTFDKSIDDIYISFDENLCSRNNNFIYCDYKDFPSSLLETLTELLKSSNLRGLIINHSESENLSFHEVVEISNYFGINIYEIINDKYKLVHKSTSLSKVLKNFEDVFLLTLALPFSLFIMASLSFLLLIFQGRPIFYTQDRVGLNGRYFKIIKFRSMNDNVIDDEELKKLNKRSKIVFKAAEDPRITKFGSFLRKSSLDELPQIINVLKNEMSFIGPRPPIISEVKQYELKHLKRISVKPGITGLWQVTLRQDNNFDRWVEKDIEYIENWSVSLDFKILLKTFNEIIGMTGE